MPWPALRTLRTAIRLVISGGAIGAIALPAGLLFGETTEFYYLFLLFVPWQVGMGMLVDWIIRHYRPIT